MCTLLKIVLTIKNVLETWHFDAALTLEIRSRKLVHVGNSYLLCEGLSNMSSLPKLSVPGQSLSLVLSNALGFFFFYSSPIQCVTYSSSQSCCVKKAAFLKLDVASEASAVQQLNQYHLTSVRFTFPPCGQLYILYLSSVVLLYHSCAIYPVFCCRVINDLSCVLF